MDGYGNPIYRSVWRHLKKHDCYFPKEYLLGMLGTSYYDYSIYYKDYLWLEEMLELADDEFVSYYVKCA